MIGPGCPKEVSHLDASMLGGWGSYLASMLPAAALNSPVAEAGRKLIDELLSSWGASAPDAPLAELTGRSPPPGSPGASQSNLAALTHDVPFSIVPSACGEGPRPSLAAFG